MKNLRIRTTSDYTFKLLSAFILCYDSVFFFVVIILQKMPIIGPYYWILLGIAIFLLVISSCRNRRRFAQIRVQDLSLVLLFFVAIEITVVLYPQNEPYIQSNLWSYIIPCIPAFFLGLSFSTDEETLDFLSRWSKIAIVVAYVYLIYDQRTRGEVIIDNMNSSYRNLFCIMLAFDYALRKRRAVDWVFAVLGIFYTLAMGTRGPLVVLFSFIVISLWQYRGWKKWLLFALPFVAVLIVIFVSNKTIYTAILNALGDFLESIGFSRRITDYLQLGKMISDSSGRDSLFYTLFQELKNRPALGFGVYGEWVYLNYFCHNTYLEVFFDYGVFLGAGLIISYVVLFLSALRHALNRITKQWLILWGALVFIRGIFGGTHLSFEVFFLLGCCLHTIRTQYGEPVKTLSYVPVHFPL